MIDERNSSLALLKKQRSHVLFVLSQPKPGQEQAFLKWYQGDCRRAMGETAAVLSAQHYERHEVDITRGRHAPLPFQYLALYEISVDGAEAAVDVIDRITTLRQAQSAAQAPANLERPLRFLMSGVFLRVAKTYGVIGQYIEVGTPRFQGWLGVTQ